MLDVVGSVSYQEICPEKGLLKFQGMETGALWQIIFRDERDVELTYNEFEILKLLATNPGIVFSKE